jgi:hypothetical protein
MVASSGMVGEGAASAGAIALRSADASSMTECGVTRSPGVTRRISAPANSAADPGLRGRRATDLQFQQMELKHRGPGGGKMHQWLVEPDFDQEGEVQRAEAVQAAQAGSVPPLLAGALGFRTWIDSGEGRAPIRAAISARSEPGAGETPARDRRGRGRN